ncbi:MAG: hypothetical protein FJ279_09220 [Planctomycetes bacterium]|nr:hypothetical protein [Planctomycetota bacterium]MBM4084718.1 hypothetical protein [Planctomycetota bacterium]
MTTLTVENLQLFLIFVVPGFIALKVYALRIPGERLDVSSAMLDAITYSMANLGLMSWLVILLRRESFAANHPVLFLLGTFVILVITPALLALGVCSFRTSEFAKRWLVHPAPSGWDFFFSQRRPCFILFHLRNGKLLGGFYGMRSFASSFPNEPDVFVEEVWRVDEYGRFTERVPDTAGCFVRYAECERIELFRAEEEK